MTTCRRVLVSLVVAVLTTLGLAGTASAAGELGLSPDGVTWGATLPAPLFNPDFRWVPGDVEFASFYVRNQDTGSAVLQVIMADTAVRSLMETGDLEIAARVGNADFVAVTSVGPQTLIQNEQIPPAGVRRIDVRVTFDPASPNGSQTKQFNLRFNVTLSQDVSVLPPTGPGDEPGNGNGNGNGPDHNGNLPGTGSTFSRGLILLAVILCAGGLGLVGVGRRDRDSKERQTTHA